MKNSKLIESLLNCVSYCNYCADACLSEENIKMMVDCIRTDRACAEVCNTTAKLLASNYANVDELVAFCKSVCEQCAAECGNHDHDHCQSCAEACTTCAEACAEYLNQ